MAGQKLHKRRMAEMSRNKQKKASRIFSATPLLLVDQAIYFTGFSI